MLVGIIGKIGIVFFSSAIISFIIAGVSGLFELGFDYLGDFVGSFMLRDLSAILTSLTGCTNVSEIQNLVT